MIDSSNTINLNINGVADIPVLNAKAVFSTFRKTESVFREQGEIMPASVPGSASEKYWPWGGNNQMPFTILDKVEQDETAVSCLKFGSESLFGGGIKYVAPEENNPHEPDVKKFFNENRMQSFMLGTAIDFKYFNFAVAVIILNADNTKICRVIRRHACYCRFSADSPSPKFIYVANWRRTPSAEDVEKIPLLDMDAPLSDLMERVKRSPNVHVYAVVIKIPTVDAPLYPIPNYGAIFRGKWYDIKQLIALAKFSKLKNSAPIRYHIEISSKYWDRLARREGIVEKDKMQARLAEEKENIISFLTGLENSGKVWFSEFYTSPDGKEQHDIVINKIDTEKEGGDWASDLQEAVNMMCFTFGVHSNLVGSVPGKSQTNNSGSDKRELYTIAQARELPYRELLFDVHRLIIAFNKWDGFEPVIPLLQLTTLDEHKDIKTTLPNND